MKYGIVVHKPTSNIGDDIQSIACEQHLPRVDYFIDREDIDQFNPVDDVAVIMAGWWMWKKFNWPPCNKIIPLFVGFHYQSFTQLNYWNTVSDEKYLGGIGRKYYEVYSPIGCRDIQTLELMQKHSIPAYFSGCITLTLDGTRYIDDELAKSKYIVLCDVDNDITEKVKEIMKGSGVDVKIVTHTIKADKDFIWEKRKKKAESLLRIYKNAICVVTYRLHAALPCLAMETPVLLIRNELDETRFHPYDGWLNFVKEEDFLNGKSEFDFYNPPSNDTKYVYYRNTMTEAIAEFIKQVQGGEISPFYHWYDKNEINEWRVGVLRETCEEYRKELEKKVHEIKFLKK